MLTVVTGVSGSGKSEYAENRAVELSGGRDLYYIATMEPYGEEGRRRVERHHKLRAGKGFTTIECYRDIESIAGIIGAERCKEATILLECMSNLLANEMFPTEDGSEEHRTARPHELPAQAEKPVKEERTVRPELPITDRLLSGMSFISRQCKHLVVVTNEVFSDGIEYDAGTEVYIKCLGVINQMLVQMADEAVEVVYTVPMIVKTSTRGKCPGCS